MKRNISLDWMQFAACVLVILQHVAEFYYVSPELKPNHTDNAILVGIFNSISRISVPLFIMISGYLLLPMKQKTTEFFKRRFTRILFPFIVWSVVYTVYFTILPYLRLWIPSIGADTYFNPSPTFYYFSGFAGYMLLGYYLRRYNPFRAWQASLAIVIGWIVTSWVFLYRLRHAETLQDLELSWGFNTINIVLMTLGAFVLLLKVRRSRFHIIDRCIISISTLSYGIYLCHVLWLWIYLKVFMPVFDNVIIVALCVVPCTLISAYITIFLLSKLPKSKYIY